MISFAVSECIIIVGVLCAVAATARPHLVTSHGLVLASCSPEHFLWLYPIFGCIIYLVACVLNATNRLPRLVGVCRCFGISILVAPFIHLIVQPCHLAIITYVTIEFCINTISVMSVESGSNHLPMHSKADIWTLTAAATLKVYVYVSYTLMEASHDGHHGVIMYLIVDAMAAFMRSVWLLAQGPVDRDNLFMIGAQRIATAQFVCQALVAQWITNTATSA